MNVLLILGLTAVITPIAVQRSTVRYEIPYVILVTAVLWALGGMEDRMLRVSDGLILWGLMLLYLAYLLGMAKRGVPLSEETPGDKDKHMTVWWMLLMIVLGAVMIVLGSDLAVDAATELALIFGMSERLIGLTIVAFGTSLPELVTSVTAAVKGKADIAVGNIVGSNIFNILFVVGTSALITPVEYAADFFVDSAVCIASAALLWLCIFRNKRLGRLGGAVMLGCYAGYFIYLIR